MPTGKKKSPGKVETITKRAYKKKAVVREKMAEAHIIRKNGGMYTASTIPKNLSDSVTYLTGSPIGVIGSDDSAIFDLCWSLYRDDGIVGSVVDAYLDMSMTKGSIENCTDESLVEILKFWAANVNNIVDEKSKLSGKGEDAFINTEAGLVPLISDSMLHYFVTGNTVLFENWSDKVLVPSLKKTFKLPIVVHLYDITSVIIDSSMAKFGVPQVTLKIDTDVINIVNRPADNKEQFNFLLRFLGKDLITQIRNGQTEVILPPILTTHFKRRGRGRLYGIPYLRRCIDSVAAKRRLQALDQATVAGLMQRMTIFCLGHDDPTSRFHIPSPERVANFATMLDSLKTENVLVWPGTDVKVVDTGPQGKVLPLDDSKKMANDDIILSLGTTRMIIDGVSTGSSKEWMIVAKIVNMLEHVRSIFKERIDKWFRLIAIKNGFEDQFPSWRWSVMDLRDPRIVNALVHKSFELGLMGYRDSLNLLSLDGDEIIANRMKEIEDGLVELLLPPSVPYSSPPNGRPPGKQDGPAVNRAIEIAASASTIAESDLLPATSLLGALSEAIRSAENHDESFIRQAIDQYIGSFTAYSTSVFTSYLPSTESHKWQSLFQGWVLQGLISFRQRMTQKLRSMVDSGISGSDLSVQMSAYFDTLSSPIKVFARAMHYKAALAANLGTMEGAGYVTARITSRGETEPCTECTKAASLREYELNEVFNVLPLHIGCHCTIVPARKMFGGVNED